MKKFSILFLFLFVTGFVSAQTVDVIVSVDMSIEAGQGRFDSTLHEVQVRGDFDGWGDGLVLDDIGDNIYEVTIEGLAANSALAYKFVFVEGETINWESVDNRTVDDVGTTNSMLDTPYFNNLTMDGLDATITFQVNMTVPAQGAFDPATNSVWVAGAGFSDPEWGEGAVLMTDDDADLIYEVTVDGLFGGDELQYKFIYGAGAATAGSWENVDNRPWLLNDGDQTTAHIWDDIPIDVELADGNVLFSINMGVMADVGIYDAVNDVLQIRGAFNGWGDSDPDISHLVQDPLNPNIWSLIIPFEAVEVGAEQFHKFFVAVADTESIWTDGYERPLSMSGGNRIVEFAGETAQEAPSVYYDDVHPDFLIPEGTSVEITFRVDMTNAIDAEVQAVPFDPAADQLFWLCEIPTFTATQGWVDSDTMQVFELTDFGDNIWKGTLTVNGPSFNAFEYRYAYVDADDGTWYHEPSGFGAAYRVRYIPQTGPSTFTQPYEAPDDVWTAAEIKGVNEGGPDGWVTGVGDDNMPTTFALEQNYPNPFNPTTTIRFNVPENGMVTLKVYNLLGQEVATLLNKEMASGEYNIHFNAAALSSGVYFYSIKTANNVATKKMMLLK